MLIKSVGDYEILGTNLASVFPDVMQFSAVTSMRFMRQLNQSCLVCRRIISLCQVTLKFNQTIFCQCIYLKIYYE